MGKGRRGLLELGIVEVREFEDSFRFVGSFRHIHGLLAVAKGFRKDMLIT